MSQTPPSSRSPFPSPLTLGPSAGLPARPPHTLDNPSHDPPTGPSQPLNGPSYSPPAVTSQALPSIETAQNQHQSASSVPSTASKITERANVLSRYLNHQPSNNKIIAIDGVDRTLVHLVIAELEYHINHNLGFTVRVIDDDTPQIHQLPEQLAFTTATEVWSSMCDEIEHSYPNFLTPPPGLILPTCVYLSPLSPLMATIKITDGMGSEGVDEERQSFRFHAEHWRGLIAPDIIIHIHNTTNTFGQGQVLVLHSMKTLLVAREQDGWMSLDPRQLRSVAFEVEGWLRDDWIHFNRARQNLH